MKKLLSVILVLSILVACLNLGIVFVSASDTTSTNDVSSLNMLDEKDSTFESGTTAWGSFNGLGTTKVVNNPLGIGKVLQYTDYPTGYTYATPYINLRPILQGKMTEAGDVYISFDVYSPDVNIYSTMCIRTYNASDYSATNTAGVTRLSLGSCNFSKGGWHTVEYKMTITEADLQMTSGSWMLCLDGMDEIIGSSIYIDNVAIYSANLTLPEKTEIVRDNYTKVGTIRWDAFTKSTQIPDDVTFEELGNYTSSSQVARVLSPSQYHDQAPFFARVTSAGKIEFPEYTVETWEKEAMYAHNAGLDYFAYLWYETTSAMSQPRKLHLQSENKNLIQMAGILEIIRSNQTMFELFDAMQDTCWLRVSGRPVLFLYNVNDTNWTSEQVESVRQMAYRAGVKEALYIVGMTSDYENVDAKVYERGMDAVSWYSYSASLQGQPYDNYTAKLESLTNAMVNATSEYDHQFIPMFSMGRDGRARIEAGVSWINGDPSAELDADKPYGNKYTLDADMATVKTHIANTYKITQDYAERTQPNLICSYGWNEHEEGGWLCPTLNCDENGNMILDNDGNPTINTERVDTLREVLDELREASYIAKPTGEPDATKTVYNGDAESGINNWGNIHGGSFGYIQPGANGTNNAIRFIPAADTGKNNSISFNIAPAIINDSAYNLSGCGAGYYKVTFWAKAKEIPTDSNAKFSVGLDVKNLHTTGSTLYDGGYISENYGNTYYGSGTVTMTTEWQQFTVTINVTESYLQMLKELRTGVGASGESLTAHAYAKNAYDVVLRLDGANMAFATTGSYEYYIDELSIEYSATNSGEYTESYPTPTPEIYVPTVTAAPTAIPQNSVIKYLEYEVGEDSVVITGSKMDIHGDITVPNTIVGLPVTEISEGAFKYRAQLTSVSLPENLKVIGDFAFEKCINLETVTMPKTITSIGTHAFCGCDKLKGSIVLSKAVTAIEPFAFYQCDSINDAQYLGSETWFNNNVTVKENNDYLVSALNYKANSIEGAVLNIGSNLEIDFYAYFEADPSLVSMLFTNENGVKHTAQGEYDSKYEMYKFTYSAINPQCMTDNIKAELVLNDGTVLAVKEEYSVKAYCDSMASKTADELNGQVPNIHLLRRVLADTLVYGAEAQIKQQYKLDDLADASEWVSGYKTAFTSPTGVKNITGNTDAENKVKSVSLNMSTYNKIYFRLVLTDETVKITLNDVEVSRDELEEQQDGTYLLYTRGLRATEFDEVFTLKLIKGEEVISTVEYNINAYIQAKYSSSSVGAMVQALNNYGVSAVNYYKAVNGKYDGDYELDDEDDLLSDVVSNDNLIPAISSNFDTAATFDDTGWKGNYGQSNIKATGIAEDGNGGKCVYYERGQETTSSGTRINFDTITFDIAPYIEKGGDYRISFKFKVEGGENNSSCSGVIRTSYTATTTSYGRTSFANENGYYNLGRVDIVADGVWGEFTTVLNVKDSDIGVGGSWNLGVQTVIDSVTKIYFDDVSLTYIDYSSMEPVHVESAETWVANEAVFISNSTYDDPYRDVEMDLVLTNGHVTYTIPCFWDGGQIWRARFVCPSAGTWTYTTVCSDSSNTGLHGQESKIICKQYTGDLDIYKHGFITANYNNSARQKYFTYADGTPFFYLGDTHWNFGSEPVSLVKNVVNKRVQQGFTVYQSQPNGATFTFTDGISTSDIPRFETFDEKFKYIAQSGLVHANSQFFFSSSMDDFIEYFGKLYGSDSADILDANGNVLQTVYGINTDAPLGTQNMYYGYYNDEGKLTSEYISVTLYDFADEVKEELELASRYWVARYSAYPVMWTLAQEVDNDFFFGDNIGTGTYGNGHPVWGKINNPYKLVAEYMNKYDPYKSPLTAHQEAATRYQTGIDAASNERNGNFWDVFEEVEAHTWYASQWKVKFTSQSINKTQTLVNMHIVPKNYWDNTDKVVINYEGYYDMLQTKEFGARAQGWFAYLSGMYGYGWGAQGTWQYLGTYGDDWAGDYVDDGVDHITLAQRQKSNKWYNALTYNSADQMGYMRDFFAYTVGDWHTLIPRFDDTNYLTRSTGAQAVIASNADNSKIVTYFCNFSDTTIAEIPNAADYGTATGTFNCLESNTTYNYMWYNPKTGKVVLVGTFTSSANGTWSAGEKKTSDMVLYIYK